MRSKIQTPVCGLNDTVLNSSITGPSGDYKLPRLALPTFGGKLRDWQSFYDLFKSTTVHENTSLSPAQKFQYLIGQLRGPAEALVRHFQIDDASYIEAFQRLVKRYDRKRSIINEFIETYIQQPQITKSSTETIGQLHDICDEVIRGLKTLGSSAESRDCWLVYLAEQKLDEVTLQLWRQESSEKDFPTIEELLEFLNKRMNSLEGFKQQTNKLQSKHSMPVKAFLTEQRPLPNCALCTGQQHRLCNCPKFLQMSLDQRRQYVNKSSRCYNCLAEGHAVYDCKSKGRCHQCRKRHHSLVHIEQNTTSVSSKAIPSTSTITNTALALFDDPETINSNGATNLHSSHSSKGSDALLPTALVEICDKFGIWQPCRALLDSASTRSYITENCASRLSLSRSNARFQINTLNGGSAGRVRGVCSPIMRSRTNTKFTIDLNTYVISKITSNLPVALNTKLGWIVGGINQPYEQPNQIITCLSTDHEISIDRSLRKLLEMEEIPTVAQFNDEEKLCVELFDKHLKQDESGKFIVSLPFKPNKSMLGDSLTQALRRFSSLEQKLQRNSQLHKDYSNFMAEYEELGHMELIPQGQIDLPNDKKYYLPHHPVFKEASTTTKLRVVFDASARSTTGVSLNETLMVGPSLQQSLAEILIRFRKHRYMFTADIEKMFRQVWIEKSDTNFLRILWRDSPTSPIKHYRLLTNTYGTASASFIATQALYKLAQLHLESHPRAAMVLTKDFYMDDLMSGASTIEEGISIQAELNSLLKLGGYHLRKWASNDVKLLENIPEDDREISIREISEGNKLISILGIKFDPQADSFSFNVSLPASAKLTKRSMLSEASRIFDPLGWLSPVTVSIKILFQRLWLLKLDWDDQLPTDVANQWIDTRGRLNLIESIKIPRWLNTYTSTTLHLCGFADASNSAYAAVIYARTLSSDGEVLTNLITAKTKVAPIKFTTTARLELCAALLLVRLLTLVINSLEFTTPPKISLWSDSTTVLAWLEPPRKESTNVQQWSYVPSKQNPADIASRGVTPSELLNDAMWWNGPAWLRYEPLQIPEQPKKPPSTKTATSSFLLKGEPENIDNKNSLIAEIIEKFSSVKKATRVLAWILRYKQNLRNPKNKFVGALTVADLYEAYKALVKEAQFKSFSAEIKCLRDKQPLKKSDIFPLNPFLDDAGILRVGGRLEHTRSQYDLKHPIILSGRHPLALKLIQEAHEEHLHSGPTLLMSIIKQQYTILRCKHLIRRVIHGCIKCFRQKKVTQQQLMGQLPSPRVNLIKPFLQTSVDYAGPYNLKTNRARKATIYKGYLVVFACMATKAVHLELASDLTSDTFIAAFRRFQSRRGICSDIYSDNGTNFVGAAKELEYFRELLSKEMEQIVNWTTINNTKWHFVPPATPHFNGLCEAAVKSTKYHLRRVLGQAILRYEELYTLLTQIEALLNSRPLCESLEDHITELTPAHFLIGQPLTMIPEPNLKTSRSTDCRDGK